MSQAKWIAGSCAPVMGVTGAGLLVSIVITFGSLLFSDFDERRNLPWTLTWGPPARHPLKRR